MTQTNIVVRFQLEGFHNFPAAKELFPEVGFLADRHRHIFHFELEKKVNHDDRDVEFILFKREVMSWLINNYKINVTSNPVLDFGSLSCESIARKLLETFELESASVFEDNENGSRIYKLK
jgi:hypothetical protein